MSPGEKVVKEFRPHWQALLSPIIALVAAFVAVALAIAFLDPPTRGWVVAGVFLLWLVVSISRIATWATTHHVITNERVIYRAGVLARRGKEIPLEVINDIAFSQSLFERMVRSGDLLIESAGEYGQSRYTDIPDPEALQSLIYQLRESRSVGFRSGGNSTASELESLVRLRDQGVLTPEEFEQQKRKLLGH